MEAEGEQDVKASDPLVPSIEVTLSHGEGVSEMQSSVHVWVGECFEILGLLVGFAGEILVSFPNVSGPLFKRDQFVSTCRVLHRFNKGAK